jgi:hypothetical protein
MDDQPRPAVVAELLEAIDSRGARQTDLLAGLLMRGAWPGGHADRSDPMAAEWLRRWGPGQMQHSHIGGCSCVRGRCVVCN